MKKQRDSIVHRAQQSFKLGTPPGGFWQAGDQIQGAPHDFPAIVEARAHIAHREPLNIDSRTLTLTIKWRLWTLLDMYMKTLLRERHFMFI